MKTNELLYALIGGSVVALAWMATHLSRAVPFEVLFGFGTLGAIFALAANDYRTRGKKA